MPNEDIRSLIKKTRVHQYEISDKMKVSEGRFSTLLRRELPDEKKEEIKAIIKELAGQEAV